MSRQPRTNAADLQKRFDDLRNKAAQNLENNLDVTLRPLIFYNMEKTLVEPSCLIPQWRNKQCSSDISFNIPEVNAPKKLFLRFCRYDVSKEQPDSFPTMLKIWINGKMFPLTCRPMNVDDELFQNNGHPLDISMHVFKGKNYIRVSWKPENIVNFCFSIYVVERLSTDIIIKNLKQTASQDPTITKKFIQEKSAKDSDGEISTTNIQISLVCPVSKSRIKVPCKSKFCQHLQCFDGETFLKIIEFKKQLKCLICHKPCLYSDVIVDEYFQQILDDENTESVTDIAIQNDGNWEIPTKKAEVIDLITPKKVKNKRSLCDDLANEMASMSLIIISDEENDDNEDSVIILDRSDAT